MATLRDTLIPLNDYPSGEFTTQPRNIPDTAVELYFEFRRCTSADPTIWPNEATILEIMAEGTSDGILWIPAGRASWEGGIHAKIGGGEFEFAFGLWRLPPPGPNRQLRAKAIITNGPLRTEGFVEFRDAVTPIPLTFNAGDR